MGLVLKSTTSHYLQLHITNKRSLCQNLRHQRQTFTSVQEQRFVKPDPVVRTCNPNTWKTEAKGSQVQVQCGKHSDFEVSLGYRVMRPWFKGGKIYFLTKRYRSAHSIKALHRNLINPYYRIYQFKFLPTLKGLPILVHQCHYSEKWDRNNHKLTEKPTVIV